MEAAAKAPCDVSTRGAPEGGGDGDSEYVVAAAAAPGDVQGSARPRVVAFAAKSAAASPSLAQITAASRAAESTTACGKGQGRRRGNVETRARCMRGRALACAGDDAAATAAAGVQWGIRRTTGTVQELPAHRKSTCAVQRRAREARLAYSLYPCWRALLAPHLEARPRVLLARHVRRLLVRQAARSERVRPVRLPVRPRLQARSRADLTSRGAKRGSRKATTNSSPASEHAPPV